LLLQELGFSEHPDPASGATAEHEPPLHHCPTLAQSTHDAPPAPHVVFERPPTQLPFASQHPTHALGPVETHAGRASGAPSEPSSPASVASGSWPEPSAPASTPESAVPGESFLLATSIGPSGAPSCAVLRARSIPASPKEASSA